MPRYAELAASTNFSFLRGASHPQEMVARAAELGLHAIGIADRNTLAGVVRAYRQVKEHPGLKLLVGARLVTMDGFAVIAYPTDRAAYGRLCKLLSAGNRAAKKGECRLTFEDILAAADGQVLIALPPARLTEGFAERLRRLAEAAPGFAYLAGAHRYRGDERRRLARLDVLGQEAGAPLVAVTDALYHAPERRPLQDVLACIREGCRVAEAGFRLEANAERHLKGPEEMARLFAAHPEAIARTVEIAELCQFSLSQIAYQYPDEPVPPGKSPQQHLEDLTWKMARWRYPEGIPEKVEALLQDEFALIAKRDYARYFLTLYDVVQFARDNGILCQGRGSAANSAVCFCLGITAVDPTKIDLLFARFLSENRDEPPDIDVDFEHERREEVIQYLYKRYGRHRAAICSTVIHYRPRMAIREVGKALGLTEDVTAALADTVWGSWGGSLPDIHVRQAGLDPANPAIRQAVDLANTLIGFPRHLSQHVGGFVLTRDRLDEIVPVGPAAMPDRTFIEWDKDDIDAVNLMKVDVLALGMLSCLKRSLTLLEGQYGLSYPTLADLPQEEKLVYEMLSRADSIGVFQVESRAQMSMLPRLKPQRFYDLVVEVAIVRPGPIQGDMVHPYLRRREAAEPVTFPSPDPGFGPKDELKGVLEKTYGVPLFQEQAMQIAITAAGFSPAEADHLRRAMATFKHVGTIGTFEEKFVGGMVRRGYDKDFAERCFNQIKGFSTYGFPESHAASFALLVYASAYVKCFHPDVFLAAILNSQPMGFYQPAQLVRDAQEHGVEVRPLDINHSAWDCTLEEVAPLPLWGRRHPRPEHVGAKRKTAQRNDARRSQSPLPALRGEGRVGGPADATSPVRGGGEGAGTEEAPLATPPHLRLRLAPTPGEGGRSPLPAPRGEEKRSGCAVRLGLRVVKGLQKAEIEAMLQARGEGFRSVDELAALPGLSRQSLERLAEADAFRSLGLDRRAALWAVRGLDDRRIARTGEETGGPGPLLAGRPQGELFPEPPVTLPPMPLPEHVAEDYVTTSLSLKAHPCAFLRPGFQAMGARPCRDLKGHGLVNGRLVTVAGLVLVRQRPGTAKGICFMTLEDETGSANVIVWPTVFEANRRVAMTGRLIAVRGRYQRQGLVIHVVAESLLDLTHRLQELREGFAPPPDTNDKHVGLDPRALKSRSFH